MFGTFTTVKEQGYNMNNNQVTQPNFKEWMEENWEEIKVGMVCATHWDKDSKQFVEMARGCNPRYDNVTDGKIVVDVTVPNTMEQITVYFNSLEPIPGQILTRLPHTIQ